MYVCLLFLSTLPPPHSSSSSSSPHSSVWTSKTINSQMTAETRGQETCWLVWWTTNQQLLFFLVPTHAHIHTHTHTRKNTHKHTAFLTRNAAQSVSQRKSEVNVQERCWGTFTLICLHFLLVYTLTAAGGFSYLLQLLQLWLIFYSEHSWYINKKQ